MPSPHYDACIMLKKGESFSADELEVVVRDVAQRLAEGDEPRLVVRSDTTIILSVDDMFLQFDHQDDDFVLIESADMAEHFNVPCQQCAERYCLHGFDNNMELFNDYLIILEELDATNKFFIIQLNTGEVF